MVCTILQTYYYLTCVADNTSISVFLFFVFCKDTANNFVSTKTAKLKIKYQNRFRVFTWNRGRAVGFSQGSLAYNAHILITPKSNPALLSVKNLCLCDKINFWWDFASVNLFSLNILKDNNLKSIVFQPVAYHFLIFFWSALNRKL